MRTLLLILLILTTSFAVALTADRLVIAHALRGGIPEYAVRLAAAMTGLFLGGIAATLLALALLWHSPRQP